MAGKPQRWTPERLAWLAATVAEHVERTGRVDWGEIARAAGTTVHGVRFAHQGHAQSGACESVPRLRARYLQQATPEAPSSMAWSSQSTNLLSLCSPGSGGCAAGKAPTNPSG